MSLYHLSPLLVIALFESSRVVAVDTETLKFWFASSTWRVITIPASRNPEPCLRRLEASQMRTGLIQYLVCVHLLFTWKILINMGSPFCVFETNVSSRYLSELLAEHQNIGPFAQVIPICSRLLNQGYLLWINWIFFFFFLSGYCLFQTAAVCFYMGLLALYIRVASCFCIHCCVTFVTLTHSLGWESTL